MLLGAIFLSLQSFFVFGVWVWRGGAGVGLKGKPGGNHRPEEGGQILRDTLSGYLCNSLVCWVQVSLKLPEFAPSAHPPNFRQPLVGGLEI